MAPDPLTLLGHLADEARLRAFAAVLLGARDTAAVARAAGLGEKEALKVLTRLESGGLVGREDGPRGAPGRGWTAYPHVLREAMAAAAPERAYVDHGAADPEEAAVLRSFLPEGRLVTMPAQESKRRVVLDHVARVFEPGARYSERQVDALLRAFWHDHATLRRYLVDYGFLAREAGEYWRIGGTVEL